MTEVTKEFIKKNEDEMCIRDRDIPAPVYDLAFEFGKTVTHNGNIRLHSFTALLESIFQGMVL